VIDRAGEHPGELGAPDAALERRHLGFGLGDHRLVVLAGAEIEQDGGVVEVACELLDRREPLLEAGALTGDGLGLLLIVPEARGEGLLFEPIDLRFQLREVKDAPLAS
jgi:hypothetical protein